VKLVTQMVAVVMVLSFGIVLDEIAVAVFGYVSLGILGYGISFFWILELTNA
jgi:hypothetical protein